MMILHVRIPVELMERLERMAEQSSMSKSEYARNALDRMCNDQNKSEV